MRNVKEPAFSGQLFCFLYYVRKIYQNRHLMPAFTPSPSMLIYDLRSFAGALLSLYRVSEPCFFLLPVHYGIPLLQKCLVWELQGLPYIGELSLGYTEEISPVAFK